MKSGSLPALCPETRLGLSSLSRRGGSLMTRYVGVDLHRRRSVIVVLEADGTELWTNRIDNDPLTLGLEIEKAGPNPEVVLEATWGWDWAAGGITQAGGAGAVG